MSTADKARGAIAEGSVGDHPPPAPSPDEAQRRADEHERRVRDEMESQFARLKDEGKALFGMVEGRPGVKSPPEWAKRLDQAGDDIGNGRFVVRYLGTERYLDAETVTVLVTLRQNLIAELPRPSTADLMMIDAAIVAYYNFLRVQGWIGNSALVFEGELFGQKPLSEIHGDMVGSRLREQLERLSEVILPLQDRCHRMMVRSLGQLARTGERRPAA